MKTPEEITENFVPKELEWLHQEIGMEAWELVYKVGYAQAIKEDRKAKTAHEKSFLRVSVENAKLREQLEAIRAALDVGDDWLDGKSEQWVAENDWDYSKWGDKRPNREAYSTMMLYEITPEIQGAWEAGYKAALKALKPYVKEKK
jgi:hypothetical protein